MIIIVDVLMCCEVVVYNVVICSLSNIFRHFQRQKFHFIRTRNEKSALENGIDLGCRLLERVLWDGSKLNLFYLSIYLKSQDYGDVGAEAQQGRLTM